MLPIALPSTLVDEITDFLVSMPTQEQIIAFKPSDRLNERLQSLLERAGEGELSDSEKKELDEFLQMSHMLKILKGKLRLNMGDTRVSPF